MANTIAITTSVVTTLGSFRDTFSPGTLSITPANVGAHCPIVSVGTSEEDLDVGDVGASTQGFIVLQNLDAANYVTFGPKSGGAMVAMGRIRAGEYAIWRLEPSAVLRWIANTAAVKVSVRVYAL
jgi:hypothetical protein